MPEPPAQASPGVAPDGHPTMQYPPVKPAPAARHAAPAPQSLSCTHDPPAMPVTVGVMHAPALHTWPVTQVLPQRPQWVRSRVTSVHTPPQTSPGGAQGVTQRPAVQSCPAVH